MMENFSKMWILQCIIGLTQITFIQIQDNCLMLGISEIQDSRDHRYHKSKFMYWVSETQPLKTGQFDDNNPNWISLTLRCLCNVYNLYPLSCFSLCNQLLFHLIYTSVNLKEINKLFEGEFTYSNLTTYKNTHNQNFIYGQLFENFENKKKLWLDVLVFWINLISMY